jgi:adenylate cyclase
LGNRVAASAHAEEVLRRQPAFTVKNLLKTLHYRQASDTEHMRDGLLKAGLPA